MAGQQLSIDPDLPLFARNPLERIDPLSGEDWDVGIVQHPRHSVFQRSAWARVLVETYGHQPIYFKYTSASGDRTWIPLMEVISPLTGRRGVSLPFSDFAGPLWSGGGGQQEVYSELARFAEGRGWRHLEIRDTEVPPEGAKAFISYDGHVLDLKGGEDALERGLDPAVRRAIRKAARSDLQLSISTEPEAMASFYQLHCETRRRHGLPPQPYPFFKSIQRNLLVCGLGEVVLARLHGTPVAGAVFLRSAGRAIYKFGASSTAHWDLRPNQGVMWHGIQHLISIGCTELHFGRTSLGNDGLSRFKRSWGCRTETLRYFRHDTRTDRWLASAGPKAESHPLIFGKLPLVLNRLAGRLIYPHLD